MIKELKSITKYKTPRDKMVCLTSFFDMVNSVIK